MTDACDIPFLADVIHCFASSFVVRRRARCMYDIVSVRDNTGGGGATSLATDLTMRLRGSKRPVVRTLCAHGACVVHVLALFHSTHPVYRALHVFPGSKWFVHSTHCTVSPAASTMSLAWLPLGITVTDIRSNRDRLPATVSSLQHMGSARRA